MGLLRASCQPFSKDHWTTSARLGAEADEVLRALTDPEAIATWAPVSFEIDGLAGGRLEAGSHERVTGSLAGIRVAFDVEVERAGPRWRRVDRRGAVRALCVLPPCRADAELLVA
jgi:hypothetical protein